MTEPLWQTHIYGLLQNPANGEILLLPTPEGAVLPRATANKPVWRADTQSVGAVLKTVMPVAFHVLRYMAFHRDPQNRRIALAYLLEPASTAGLPAGVWVSPEEITRQELLPNNLLPAFDAWRDEQRLGTAPLQRPPWVQPGWLAGALDWAASTLAEAGFGPIQAYETIKSWGISFVLKVLAGAGSEPETFYFKASRPLPLFAEEGTVTQALAGLFPEYVAPPLAVDRARRWMLVTRQGESLPWSPPVELHEAIYATLARLQIASIPHLDALQKAGCLDRRLPLLSAQLPGILVDEVILTRLTADERQQLLAALPRFLECIENLDALDLPDTLIHGDFHTGNIADRNGQHLIFDWSDASYGHPFMDLLTLGDQTNQAKRTRVQNAYLAPWQAIASEETLLAAYDLAQVVYPLYHAASYQAILHNLEPAARTELDIVPELLRLALQNLQEYDRKLALPSVEPAA